MGASVPRPGASGRDRAASGRRVPPRPVARGCAAAVAPSPDRPTHSRGVTARRPGAASFSSSRVAPPSPSGDGTSTYDITVPMITPVSCTPGFDREDTSRGPPAERGAEWLANLRLGKSAQLAGRAAAEVVDQVVGVRREPDLRHPRPNAVGGRPHGDPAPRLEGRRLHNVVTGITEGDLRVGDSPAVADHHSPLSRPVVLVVPAARRYRPRSGSPPAPSPHSVGQCRP